MERAVAARKNITIDLEAYERLRALRRDKESISQVIMRVVRPPFDIAGFPAQGGEHFARQNRFRRHAPPGPRPGDLLTIARRPGSIEDAGVAGLRAVAISLGGV